MHKHLEEFLILIPEITPVKEGLHQIIITKEPILNLLIDEVIVLLEIILLEVQARQVAADLLQEVPQPDQHHHLQEVHLLQEARLLLEVVQDVLNDKKK